MTMFESSQGQADPSGAPAKWVPRLGERAQIISESPATEVGTRRGLVSGTLGVLAVKYEYPPDTWGFQPDGSTGAVSVHTRELGPPEPKVEE